MVDVKASDTPRSNAANMPFTTRDPNKGPALVSRGGVVDVEFARALERELRAVSQCLVNGVDKRDWTDCGPEGEGWTSPEMSDAVEIARRALT